MIAFFSSFDKKSMLMKLCACSVAARWAKVHDVDRSFALVEEVGDRVVERLLAVLEVEWDGSIGALDQGRLDTGEICDRLLKQARVTERCAHQQESRLRQGQ